MSCRLRSFLHEMKYNIYAMGSYSRLVPSDIKRTNLISSRRKMLSSCLYLSMTCLKYVSIVSGLFLTAF